MNEEINAVDSFLEQEIKIHQTKLNGKSGKSPDWEAGFVAGLKHIRASIKIKSRKSIYALTQP